MKRLAKAGLGLFLVLFVALSVAAQKPKPQMSGQKTDRFEEAHRGLFAPRPNKAAEASRLTEQAVGTFSRTAQGSHQIVRKNLIDEHIFGRMERDGIPHARLSSDEEFIRRVYLDAIGALPPADVVREFLAGKDPLKRDAVIDNLVGTEEFAEQWAWYWGDLFRLEGRSGQGKHAFHFWNKEWLRLDRPYNAVAYDLLTGVAKSHSTIPALAFLARNSNGTNRMPHSKDDYISGNRLDGVDQFSVDVARIFLGLNISCISCHDGAGHLEPINLYLTRKTRREFHRQAAFFGRTRIIMTWDDRSKNGSEGDMIIDDLADGYDTGKDAPFHTASEIYYPRDGRRYEPAFLLTGEEPRPDANPRAELARLLTNHIQFSRATVNLIWDQLMTVAFVEPYDGFDLDRLDPEKPPPDPWRVQPTSPELLQALAEYFRDHNFSVQSLIKTVMKSSAYQLSSRFDGDWKEAYTPYYARKFVRVLTGPEVVDAIAQATGRPGQFEFSGVQVSRVKQLSSPSDVGGRRKGGEATAVDAIMQSFFQSNRQTPPAIGNKASTLQALLMMSSSFVNDRVRAEEESRVQQLVESNMANERVIDELFLSTLARQPTRAEKEIAVQELENDRKQGAENLQWALLNGIEFILNH